MIRQVCSSRGLANLTVGQIVCVDKCDVTTCFMATKKQGHGTCQSITKMDILFFGGSRGYFISLKLTFC